MVSDDAHAVAFDKLNPFSEFVYGRNAGHQCFWVPPRHETLPRFAFAEKPRTWGQNTAALNAITEYAPKRSCCGVFVGRAKHLKHPLAAYPEIEDTFGE